MSESPQVLIAGNGLAAHVLALSLKRSGINVSVVGTVLAGAASPVAYGMINPVHLRTAELAWKADVFVPFALDFYQEIQDLNPANRWFFPSGITHFCAHEEEANLFRMQAESGPLFGWIQWADSSLSFKIPQAAYIDTPGLLAALRAEIGEAQIQDNHWVYEDFLPESSGWSFHGQRYSHVIFAEGFRVLENPFFGVVPFKPNKGQGIHVEGPDLPTPYCWHKTYFYMGLPGKPWKIGSTYQSRFQGLDIEKSEEVMLLKAADEQGFKTDSYVSWTGIRPASGDRRPVIGAHPYMPGLYLFNGLGSRGLSMVPTMANLMVQFLKGDASLWPEVDVVRFSKRLGQLRNTLPIGS
jgi:glycine oxidase